MLECIRKKYLEIVIWWYDFMVSTGNVSYEDSLNNINAPFFQNRNIKTIA